MRRHIQVLFWALVLILCTALPVQAAVKSYTVLPFAIHGPQEYRYLSEGIRSMLVSRLGWEDNFESTPSDSTTASAKDITSQDAASTLRQKIGTDYLVWGSATIMGEQASLDVSMLGPETTTTKTRQTALDDLIPAMEEIANELSNEVFGKPEAEQTEPEQAQTQQSGPTNPNFVVNESGEGRSSLNPQIEYQGSPSTPGRWRSQSLPFESRGMAIGDADGDGNCEYFFMEENNIRAFRKKQNRLIEIANFEADRRDQYLNINLYDSNNDGQKELYISAIHSDRVRSFILQFKKDKFTVLADKINYFLNVVRTPPEFMQQLVAQRMGSTRLFQGKIHELVKMNGEYNLGPVVGLPDKANIFNFTFLPHKESFKVILVSSSNKLMVYNDSFSIQFSTEELYAASDIGIEIDESMPGLNQTKTWESKFYYIPHKPLIANLDGDESFEVIVDRNISVSAQIFQRYRSFPQGEIHSLFWDGVGLNIEWKTRRIKGTIVGLDITDPDTDGELELAVCLNTHPGATGFDNKKTILLLYSLGNSTLKAFENTD